MDLDDDEEFKTNSWMTHYLLHQRDICILVDNNYFKMKGD